MQQSMGGICEKCGRKDEQCSAPRNEVGVSFEGATLKANGEQYLIMPLGDTCMSVVCTVLGCCPKKFMYTNRKGDKAMEISDPGCCKALFCCTPWSVKAGEFGNMSKAEKKATVIPKTSGGCCKCFESTNGCAFSPCGMMFCIPWCVCKGHMKHLMVVDGNNEETRTILQELVPGHPIVTCMADWCTPVGMMCAGFHACCKFLSGKPIRIMEQPIYGKLETRDSPPQQTGTIIQTHCMAPISCCSAVPTLPIRYIYKKNDSTPLTDQEVYEMTLLLAMYRGLYFPDCLGKVRPRFPQPLGAPCTDNGLHSKTRYVNFREAQEIGTFDF